MSFPPQRPPMVPGMFMGVPPNMGMPPPMMNVPPPNNSSGPVAGGGPRPRQFFPGMRPGMPPPRFLKGSHNNYQGNEARPLDHPQPQPNQGKPSGPPVTVFVGNITEKWPDPMIRQLLATCGQVIHWKRVQGASGKLQGFGFCEFAGPDSGLRAVRLLHDLEVGDKKLVVKVDGKTSTVLEEFKAEKRKNKQGSEGEAAEEDKEKESEKADENDYMDEDMKEADEQSKSRIEIIFREFKSELESYVPPSTNTDKERKVTESANAKQQIQEKLHLLKLSSLEAGEMLSEELGEDLAMEEGKREIITREISNFREHMKAEKEKEEERKKANRERREREREREKEREERRKKDGSPDRVRRSPGRRDRDSDRDRRDKDRFRGDRDREYGRDRDRDRVRRNRTRSRSRSRETGRVLRSPMRDGPPKPRYREREEEEEAAEQRRLEKKAREREAAYEERLKEWEARERQKAKEYKKIRDKLKRQEDEMIHQAKKMKQFLEDYDDEKHDSKFYRGKDLQKRLAERAKELEGDNKDRQKEREELEDMKLRLMSSNTVTPSTTATSTPTRFLDRYKKPMLDTTNTSVSNSPAISSLNVPKLNFDSKKSPIASRLQAMANTGISSSSHAPSQQQNILSKMDRIAKSPLQAQPIEQPQQNSFNSIQFNAFIPVNSKSNQSTPNNMSSISPIQCSNSNDSLKKTPGDSGFHVSMNAAANNSNGSVGVLAKDDNSRQSFSSPGSAGMPSPIHNDMDSEISPHDSSRKRKMDVKDVFNQDEDDDRMGAARKRKLVPLDYEDEESKRLKREEKIPEDKKKHIKALIEKIPTEKEALFSYEIDWEMVDNTLMEKRIRPWINKKIIEYIGEPEPTLVDFICSKVLGQSAPQSILDDVMMVLDEEAEVFVVKMWRLLVYEIEAKKLGVASTKNP